MTASLWNRPTDTMPEYGKLVLACWNENSPSEVALIRCYDYGEWVYIDGSRCNAPNFWTSIPVLPEKETRVCDSPYCNKQVTISKSIGPASYLNVCDECMSKMYSDAELTI